MEAHAHLRIIQCGGPDECRVHSDVRLKPFVAGHHLCVVSKGRTIMSSSKVDEHE